MGGSSQGGYQGGASQGGMTPGNQNYHHGAPAMGAAASYHTPPAGAGVHGYPPGLHPQHQQLQLAQLQAQTQAALQIPQVILASFYIIVV